jgi:septum formation protein
VDGFGPSGDKRCRLPAAWFSPILAVEQTGTVWKSRAMLILASQSAARKALLAGAGLRFETSPAQIDERALEAEKLGKGGSASDVASALAEAKALSVAANHAGALVIGADQVLALPGSLADILHKPRDMAEAAVQLDRLRGRTHQLHSGVALARDGKVLWSSVETASLTLRPFTDAERDRVLAQEGEAVLGSVGSYRLEGPSIKMFERIEGDYFTILGLPLLPLLAALRAHAPTLME